MRTLVITENMTADGSIELLSDWFDPQAQAADDMADLHEELQRQGSQSDAFLVGRHTFEQLRSYWPAQTDDKTGVTDYLNQVDKYVVSTTMTEPGWQNTTVLADDPVQQVTELKRRSGSDIVLTGSIQLAHTLIEAGIVDEFRLFVYPAVQGRGRRLFPDGLEMPRLRLLQTRTFQSGIVLLCYAAA